MISVREFLGKVGWLGHPHIWIVKHFFGYKYYGHRETNSLRKQILLLSHGLIININAIQVGDKFDISEKKMIDAIVEAARQHMAEHGLAINILRHSKISESMLKNRNCENILDSDGKAVITRYRPARKVMARFSDYSYGLDTFFVHEILIDNLMGFSPILHGPCTKNLMIDDGIFVELPSGGFIPWDLGHTLFHEIGHYVGLDHRSDPNNLMCGGNNECKINSNNLTDYQKNIFRVHCFFYSFGF